MFRPLGQTNLQAEVVDFIGAQDVGVRDENAGEAADADRRRGPLAVFAG
jgi:hypothetical protein